MVSAIDKPPVLLVEDAHRHPFTDDDQIELAIAVVVHPHCATDHPDGIEAGRFLGGNVAEVPVPVVLQQVTPRCHAVLARHDAAADEQIDVAVAIEIARHDTGAVVEEVRQRVRGALEVAAAIVEVKAVVQRLALPELVATAHDVEIEITIAVRVEEGGVDIFVQAVGAERRLERSVQRTVGGLPQQLARLPLGAAGVDVFPPIAIHVGDRERWALGREQVRHQRLAAVVEECVFVVLIGRR